MGIRTMKPIPIIEAEKIADKYNYDQIIIIGRKIGEGEHVTTYGKNRIHCSIAAKIGNFLKYKIMGWENEERHKEEESRESEPREYQEDANEARTNYSISEAV